MSQVVLIVNTEDDEYAIGPFSDEYAADDYSVTISGPGTHFDVLPFLPPRKPDPRDPDHSRKGMFVYHNCAQCGDGERQCVRGNPRQCEFPHARND